MPMPNYQIQGAPNMMNDPSAMDLAKNFAMQEGLNYGLDMMFPGAGVARRGAEAIAPAFLNRGGPLYLRPGGDWRSYFSPGASGNVGLTRGAGDTNVGNWSGYGYSEGELDEMFAGHGDYSDALRQRIGADAQDTLDSLYDYGYEGLEKNKPKPAPTPAPKAAPEAKPEAPLQKKKPGKKAAAKKAAPRPDPRAQGGVDWNVGLGNVGGWDLSTSGNYTLMDNAKDPYKVRLDAKRAFDTNRLFGAAPLEGRPKSRGRYADYEGGEYRERMPGERITTDIQRGRKPATNPLQPYLDAGISPEQAEMLMANKVPPPRPMNRGGPIGGGQTKEGLKEARALGALTREEYLKAMSHAGYKNRGGPIYMNEGGKVPWWKSALAHAWENDGMMKRAEQQRRKTQDTQANKKALSEGDIGSFLGSAAKMFFNKGGGVSPSAGMEGPIAGMTPGPLGMSDLIAAGKDKDIAKVSYKKTGGKVSQQVDIAYHNPLQPKPSSGE